MKNLDLGTVSKIICALFVEDSTRGVLDIPQVLVRILAEMLEELKEKGVGWGG